MEGLDVNTISTVISTVGFPIVACCGLFYLYNKTLTRLTATLEKVDKTLDKMSDRIDALEKQVSGR